MIFQHTVITSKPSVSNWGHYESSAIISSIKESPIDLERSLEILNSISPQFSVSGGDYWKKDFFLPSNHVAEFVKLYGLNIDLWYNSFRKLFPCLAVSIQDRVKKLAAIEEKNPEHFHRVQP